MDIHDRLKSARKSAEFETAADAAAALGIPYQTYAGHENGSSGFRPNKGKLYAKRFKVRFEWLMTGTGPMRDLSSKYDEVLKLFDQLPGPLQTSYVEILRSLVDKSPGGEPGSSD